MQTFSGAILFKQALFKTGDAKHLSLTPKVRLETVLSLTQQGSGNGKQATWGRGLASFFVRHPVSLSAHKLPGEEASIGEKEEASRQITSRGATDHHRT